MSKPAPRILFLSPPWPYKSIRHLHVARALQQIGKVEVIVVDSVGGEQKSVEALGTEFKVGCELKMQPRPHNGLAGKLRWALDPDSPYPHGVGVSDEGNRLLLKNASEFDLIWFTKLRTANMFENQRWPGSVLDVDDLPSGVYKSVWQSSRGLKKRLGALREMVYWRRREKRLAARFPVLAVCSEQDKRSLRADAPVHVIPNGYERPTSPPLRQVAAPPRIGFVGLFDYYPNVEGVKWFIDHCWGAIKREVPGARLRLMGRESARAIQCAEADIDKLGWVEDGAAEIATWALMIVPLHVGGGLRVKIAEGFSCKCPVVATRLGAFGYDVQAGRELLLADDPAGFAQACVSILRDPDAASAMAQRAYERFLEKWTWDAIAPRIWKAADDGLRLKG